MNLIRYLKKILKFLLKKYLSFPTLSFVMSNHNSLIKKFYIEFWVYISKRNKFFRKFFFDNKNANFEYDKIIFELNNKIENIDEDCLSSLSKNGILILENALSKNEHDSIVNIFDKIFITHNQNFRSNNSVIRYFESFDINNFKFLKSVSDYFTKQVYGRILNTNAELYIHKSLKIPEDIEPGDNNYHIDRFLPNMKILYSPFEITKNSAPFCYALGSHKINDYYLNFVKNSKKFDESEMDASFFLKDKKEIVCKSNSIIVALTSGFHGRKSFETLSERKLIFLQYHKSFNKISLLLGK